MKQKMHARGVALIEVMIAVLILAIGLVGAIGLQAKSLAALSNAGARVDAAIAAEKVIGLMSTDLANLANYAWDSTGGTTAPAVLATWWKEVGTGDATTTPPTPPVLPTATAVITVTPFAAPSNATQVSITLTWQRRTGINADPVNTHTIVATIGPTT